MKARCTYHLDVSGLLCPYPLLKAKLKLKSMKIGETLCVISTDPASIIDFKVFAETSEEVSIINFQKEKKYIFEIEKL
jgi:tRNA 2-thiouridine synthesizing protein A